MSTQVTCAAHAVLHPFQRQAMEMASPSLPDQHDWQETSALKFEEALLSRMTDSGAPLLEAHQAPTARLQLFMRAISDKNGSRRLHVSDGSEMSRWTAGLINDVERTQPQLLGRLGSWLLRGGNTVNILRFCCDFGVHPDLATLSLPARQLLLSCLDADQLRDLTFPLVQDASARPLFWADSLAESADSDAVKRHLFKADSVESLCRVAVKPDAEGAAARGLLGRLAEAMGEGRRAGFWGADVSASRTDPFSTLATALVGRICKGETFDIGTLPPAVGHLARLAEVEEREAVRLFAKSFCHAVYRWAVQPGALNWTNASNYFSTQSQGGRGRVDVLGQLFGYLDSHGQLTPAFVADFRSSYWAQPPYDFAAASVNARLVELEMRHRIEAMPTPAAATSPARRRAAL